MIKHSIKDELLYISINNQDFSYRIPVKKLGTTIEWIIGTKGAKGITIKNVSKWTLHLFTKKTTEEKYVRQFKSIVQEHAPNNMINWDKTLLAVTVQNEYNWMVDTNKTADKKMTTDDIMSILKTKHKLD
jgi:hypothetical protein